MMNNRKILNVHNKDFLKTSGKKSFLADLVAEVIVIHKIKQEFFSNLTIKEK